MANAYHNVTRSIFVNFVIKLNSMHYYVLFVVKNARISCSFESGACGWGNDDKNKQKWLLNSGATKSSKTGPSNDNTFGTGKGITLTVKLTLLIGNKISFFIII